jgi:diguanylate cyclase (GGDEF)-like protein
MKLARRLDRYPQGMPELTSKTPTSSATEVSSTATPPGRRSRRVLWSLLVMGLFAVSVAAASYVMRSDSGRVVVTASILILMAAVVVLLLVAGVVRELIHWRRPMRELARVVNEIRAGEAPLADLDRLKGGAAQFVEPIRGVLLDLKEQKRQYASLQEEMRSRILSRTDALERQLGTIKAQAARDPLTALGNRRAYEQALPEVFKACRSANQDLCVLMIDVDNFKPLNDTLGHAAGDEFLKQVGELLRSSIREHDTAYRVGGDEFVVLLPRASRAIGEKLAGRIVGLIVHLVRPMKLPHPPGLSIGVAALSDKRFDNAADLIACADKALYEAKQSNPNRKPRSAA